MPKGDYVYWMHRSCARCGNDFQINRSTNYHCSTECLFLDSFIPGYPFDCWKWLGKTNPEGYAGLSDIRANRFSYEYYVGQIPRGLGILHTCNNKGCINPTHLYPGNDLQNCVDRKNAGRDAR